MVPAISPTARPLSSAAVAIWPAEADSVADVSDISPIISAVWTRIIS